MILKKGCRICGTGGAIATAPLVQSKAYFEVKIQQSGQWSIGLATSKTDLNSSRGGKDSESWCLGSDNIVLHNGNELHRLSQVPADTTSSLDNINGPLPGSGPVETGIPTEGDIIGIAYDHVELNYYLNGKKLDIPVLGVKGTVYPVLFGKPDHYYANANSSEIFFIPFFFWFLVDDGAILDIILDEFCYGPPPGFDKIMLEQSLL